MDPSSIKNKIRRSALFQKQKAEKNAVKKQEREKRKKMEAEVANNGGDPKQLPPKKLQRTLDNTREYDETIVLPDDKEVVDDEQVDEFADYFRGTIPKILITTSVHATEVLY